MSHLVTTWAIARRGLRPTTRVVLWALADAHNARTGRCDPSQATLAKICEISRSVLNTHLALLEASGLIRRIRRADRDTRSKRSTFYQLAIEGSFASSTTPCEGADGASDPGIPCPESGHTPMSCLPDNPSPASRTTLVRQAGHKPGREPYPPTPLADGGIVESENCDERIAGRRTKRAPAKRRGAVAGITSGSLSRGCRGGLIAESWRLGRTRPNETQATILAELVVALERALIPAKQELIGHLVETLMWHCPAPARSEEAAASVAADWLRDLPAAPA